MADNLDSLSIKISASTDEARKNIDSLSNSLNKLGSTLSKNINSTKLSAVASSFTELAKATKSFGSSTKAIDNIPKLSTALSDMASSMANAPQISDNMIKMAEAMAQLSKNGANVKNATKGIGNAMSEATKSLSPQGGSKDIDDINKKLDDMSKKTKEVSENAKKLKQAKLIVKGFGNAVGGIRKFFTNASAKVKEFGENNKKTFKKGLTWALKYIVGVRSIYFLWRKIRSAVEDNNKLLVQYSSAFNTSMSKIKSAFTVLGASVSVAFAPIVNAVAEACSEVIKRVAEMFNTLARLFATFTGAKKVVQVNTDYMYDYAKSLDKASKSAHTLGIDELNILSESGGSSSSTNVNDLFNTEDVDSEFESIKDRIKKAWDENNFFDFGRNIADKINSSLQDINWEKIKNTASRLGKDLGTLVDGFVTEELNGISLGWEIGHTIGEAINTGVNFAYEFASTPNLWKDLGQFVADMFKGGLETVDWKKAGQTVSKFVNGFLEALTTFFKDKQLWTDLGKSIGDFFSGIDWKSTWFNLKELAKAIWSAIRTSIESWAQTDACSLAIASAIGGGLIMLKVANAITTVITGSSLGVNIVKAICQSIKASMTAETVTSALGGKGALAQEFGTGFVNAITGVAFSAMFTEAIEGAIKTSQGKMRTVNGWKTKDEMSKQFEKNQKDDALKIDGAEYITNVGNPIKELIEHFKELKNQSNEAKTSISELGIEFGIQGEIIKTASTQIGDYYVPNVQTATEETSTFSQTVSDKWNEIKTNGSTLWNDISLSVSTSLADAKTKGTKNIEDLKTKAKTNWETMKKDTSDKFKLMKDSVVKSFEEMWTQGKSKVVNFANGVINILNNVIGGIESMINEALRGLQSLLDKASEIPGFGWVSGFNLQVTLNRIKPLALETGGYVPNTNMGTLFWSGENGAEVVAHASGGTEVLNASQVGEAVAIGVRSAVEQYVQPYLNQLVNSNEAIANKEMTVAIGDRDIARANQRGQRSMGLQLRTT